MLNEIQHLNVTEARLKFFAAFILFSTRALHSIRARTNFNFEIIKYDRLIQNNMSQQQDIVVTELNLSERDFVFQSVLSRKNQTLQYLQVMKREIEISDYNTQRWFKKPWEQVTIAKQAILAVLAGPKVSIQWRGVEYKYSELKEKYNDDEELLFLCYMDSYIGNLSEEELIKLESHHININHHLYTLIGAVEYDRASNGP